MRNLLSFTMMLLLCAPAAWAEGESCKNDADCAEGEACAFADLTVDCPPCPEGEKCPPCGEEGDGEEATGECVPNNGGSFTPPAELICETDDDCGLGLVCVERTFGCGPSDVKVEPPKQSQSGASGSSGSFGTATDCVCECEPDDEACMAECDCEGDEDGGDEDGGDEDGGDEDGGDAKNDTPPEEVEEVECVGEVVSLCAMDPADCTTDADCLEGFQCHEIEECWASSATACFCPEEEEDCDCEEQGSQEEESGCSVVDSHCVPELVACADDDECEEGWVCVPLPKGAQENQGMEKSCMPAGWDSLVAAHVQESLPMEAGETGADFFDTNNGADGETNPPGDNEEGDGSQAGNKKEAAKEAASGLCSLGNSGQLGGAALLLLLGFSWVLLRRRERLEL